MYKEKKPKSNDPLKKKRREKEFIIPKIKVKTRRGQKENFLRLENPFLQMLHRGGRGILLAPRVTFETKFVFTSDYRGTGNNHVLL